MSGLHPLTVTPTPGTLALIADDTAGSRELTRMALAASGATTIVLDSSAEFSTALPRGRQPDVVVVDMDFGGQGQGMRLVESALRLSDATVIVVGAELDAAAMAALSERCHVLHRPVHGGQLRTTLRLALVQRARRRGDGPNGLEQLLRPREREIARLLLEHHRGPAVAKALGISAHTVRNHLKNMYRRLGVHSQMELIRLLYDNDAA